MTSHLSLTKFCCEHLSKILEVYHKYTISLIFVYKSAIYLFLPKELPENFLSMCKNIVQ